MYEVFEQLIRNLGVTAYRVAKDAGISQSSLSDWKNGKGVPGAETMLKIANYLDVSVEYLMTGDESKREVQWPFFRSNINAVTPPTPKEADTAQREIDRMSAAIAKPVQEMMQGTARHIEIVEAGRGFLELYNKYLNDTGKDKIHRYAEDLAKNPENLYHGAIPLDDEDPKE